MSERDRLIEKLFDAHARELRWGYLDLNSLALHDFENVEPNPLVDAQTCEAWLNDLHHLKHLDASYGGHLEDRKDLWRGHYHEKGKTIHLGVDYNVPEGTQVFAPVDSEVVEVWNDPDTRGGWGGRVILKNKKGLFLILAHLDAKGLPRVNAKLKAGDLIGRVGTIEQNGNWFPHLHAQILKTYPQDVDGYGWDHVDNREGFPHPELFLE